MRNLLTAIALTFTASSAYAMDMEAATGEVKDAASVAAIEVTEAVDAAADTATDTASETAADTMKSAEDAMKGMTDSK